MQAIARNQGLQKVSGLRDIACRYHNFLFDLDGVVWVGSQPVPGAFEALAFLQSLNKRMFFITNNSTRNRLEIKERFSKFGLQIEVNDVYCTSHIAGLYLEKHYPLVKNVLVGGTKSMASEIEGFGYNVIHAPNIGNETELQFIVQNLHDPSVEALVFGEDPHFNYRKACMYSYYLHKGVHFLGTNPDKTNMRHFKVPGVGSMISMLELATGRKAEIIGKPNPLTLELLIERNDLIRSECLMVGDNLETDILFGKTGGLDTLAVLSGVSSEQKILLSQNNRPDYYSQTI